MKTKMRQYFAGGLVLSGWVNPAPPPPMKIAPTSSLYDE